jgi:prepilin-type N-terminal cleavage/methylation domain-containing protein
MAGGDRAGFTLLEMMIALAITGMAAAGLEQLLVGQIRQLSRQEATAERRQEGRAALAVLVRELSLVGFPAEPDPACHVMINGVEVEPSTVRFLANLYGVATRLEVPAAVGETVLRIPDDARIRAGEGAVSPGTAFAAHDVIYLHDPGRPGDPADDRVECHRLEREGRAGEIALADGDAIRRPFPAGSRVQVINEVRYAYDAARRELLRTVDGGTQSVADGVESAEFSRQRGRITARLVHDPGPAGPGALIRRDQWEAQVAMRNAGTIAE